MTTRKTQVLKDKAWELNKLFWDAGIDMEFYYFTDGVNTIFCPEFTPDEERN